MDGHRSGNRTGHGEIRRSRPTGDPDLQAALDHIDQATRLVNSVQAAEHNGARWSDLETARRSLHGAAIAMVDCELQGGPDMARSSIRG